MRAKERITQLLGLAGENGLIGSHVAWITGVGLWRFYPIMIRLETEGLVMSRFDPGPYPRRRRYWLAEYAPSDADTIECDD